MMWRELFEGKSFISDLGSPQEATKDGKTISIGQYAVLVPVEGTDRHTIMEVGENLEALMKKYRIPPERVCSVVMGM